MIIMGRRGVISLLVGHALLASTFASADADLSTSALESTADASDTTKCLTMRADRRWPGVPQDNQLSLEDQITDHLSDLGNALGNHMGVLSDHLVGLSVDGRRNRARLHLGGGNVHYLTFNVDSDWLFTDGMAHVKAKLELGIAGHEVKFQLPDMDVIPDNYHGQDLVQVNVSVLERRF